MGLGCDAISLLGWLKQSGFIDKPGRVMEIGAQQLANSFLEDRKGISELAALFHIPEPLRLPTPLATHLVHGSLQHLDAAAPRADKFWKWLGFSYAAIDIDGSPGSIPLDLNYDDIPESEVGKYGLVTNFGTTEHVANQLNAFKVIHELTAVGGVMIHHLPAQGMFNHGLVNYNPKFFWMLARSNGYELAYMNFQSGECSYPLPQNIVDNVVPFEPQAKQRLASYQSADCLLVAVLRKTFDIPFVAPIDVPTGAHVNNKALEERYWTVFKPNAFRDLSGQKRIIPSLARIKKRLWG